mgnify:CR=1 FL=1
MADESSTGIVAVLVIFVMVVVGGLFAYRSGVVGDGGKDIDIKVEIPKVDVPAVPAPAKKAE